MIKMHEVVGISDKSFSDAAKNAVDSVKDNGKVHWFEVTEQRGTLKGDTIEYQIKAKVAVQE